MKIHVRVATILLVIMSMVAFAQGAFADFGPPPPGVTITPGGENCNGIVPTPGSENTVKTLTGLTVDASGTHATYSIAYPVDPSSVGDSFQIVDCVLSGSGSDLSSYTVLDEATFDGVVNSTAFNLTFTYTIPPNTPVGTRICNVAKTTEGPSAPSASNRKAGPACFIVGGDARVEKHAADDPNGPVIPGATFTVWNCNNTAIDPTLQPIIVTPAPSSGDIYSSTLAGGGVVHATAGTVAFSGPSGSTCNVTETSPPPGYDLPPVADRTITITIPSGSSGATVYKFLDPLPPPDLTITKTADASPVNAGDPIGFTITVHNAGSGPATNVSMTDTLPTTAGLSWTIAGTTGSPTCSITAGVLTCTKSSLAVGGTFTVHITSPTTSASCTTINNTATVGADNNDGTPQDSASVVVNCPSLSITKVADATTVNAGDTIGYTITVTNNGAGTASGVKLSDTLPTNAGLSWSFDSPSAGWGGTCAINAGVLTCGGANGVSLASGAHLSVHISSPTTSATCGTVANSASATSANDGSPTVGPVNITVNCADLSITKTADASTVNAGDSIGYTITVTNNGAGTASGVKLSDTLPTNGGLSWSFDNPSAGWGGTCAINAGVLTCGGANGVSLASGAHLSVHISSPTTSATCPTVSNSASATSANDGSPTVGPVNITVNCADLSITKVADASTVSAGDTIGYTITVHNGGAGTASGVKLSDTLPTDAGLSWSFDSPSAGWGGTCAINAGVLTCGGASGVSLAAGASLSVHISSPTTSATCGVVHNSASAVSGNDGSPSVGPVDITVNCPDLSITKVADASTVSAGEDIGYTITVTNNGAGTASGVKLSDTLPTDAGLSWSFDSPSAGWGGTCAINAGVLTCGGANGVSLASEASLSVHISSPTTSASCGVVHNSASATSGNDGSPSVGPVDITVNCPSLGITKTADASPVESGNTIGFTITVTNAGPGDATGVTMTDTLPVNTGLSWTIAGTTGGPTCSIAAGVLTCTVDSLSAEGSFSVHITSPTTAGSTCGLVPNTAAVSAENSDSSPQASASTTLLCPKIQIVKTVTPTSGQPGNLVTYKYEVTNTGNTTLTNVTVTDDKLGTIVTGVTLLPGEKKTYFKTVPLPNAAGLLTNVGTASGTDVLGKTVHAHDNATVTVVLPVIILPKTGTDSRFPTEAGFVLLGLGLMFVAISRKRRQVLPETIEREDG